MQMKPLHSVTFYYLILLLSLGLYHWPLMQFAASKLDLSHWAGMQTLVTVLALITLLSCVVFGALLLVSRRLFKLVLSFVALTNALALYFMLTYQVIIDRTMIGNIVNTDMSEAGELWHPKLLLYLLVLGVGPIVLLWQWPIQKIRRLRLLAHSALVAVLCIGWMAASGSTWLWIDKHAKQLGGQILPWGYVANSLRYYAAYAEANAPQQPLPPLTKQAQGKRLVVLVIGETARKQNFALYGYERPTNPKLLTTGAIAMNNPVACSTYTTASIKCMLSHADPATLDANYEVLPSYLHRHGMEVIWHSNNWGQPPMSVTSYRRAGELVTTCDGPNCHLDDVLLTGLKARIQAAESDKVLIVLHQKGSHGPAYHTRYGEGQAVFQPVCESVDLAQCEPMALMNAYDNSIVHTDALLFDTITMLKQLPDWPSTMVYMSDHGESLGEFGLYLHGTPYAIAPEVQKQVPMIVWMSDSFQQQAKVDGQKINQRQYHDQHMIFHSIMGALGLKNDVYQPLLDIFHHQENP